MVFDVRSFFAFWLLQPLVSPTLTIRVENDTVGGIIAGMTRSRKRLEAMRSNRRGDWGIDDVQAICDAFGIRCSPPSRGGHYKVSHPASEEILTIPASRPLRPVYIKKLVALVDLVLSSNE
jgi:hypothetical protein